MSRIGKMPVKILEGVKVDVDGNNVVTVSGPLGSLSQIVDKNITVKVENNEVIVTRNSDENEIKAKHDEAAVKIQELETQLADFEAIKAERDELKKAVDKLEAQIEKLKK